MFSDPDADSGDSLKAVKVVTLPASHGARVAGAERDGGERQPGDRAQADLGTLVFTPVADWNGEASFTFKVADQSDAESATRRGGHDHGDGGGRRAGGGTR